jgi:hypothetical protein
MKTVLFRIFGLLVLSTALLLVSCGDDDEGVTIDPGEGEVNVSDGIYITLEGENPSSTAGISSEVVEAPDFASQDRSGFFGGFVYLEAGNYNVVEVASKEIAATWGGSASVVTDTTNSKCDCEYDDFILVTPEVDGAAINVAEAGLYRITLDLFDETRRELILQNVGNVAIIGNATEGGWSTETPLDGTVDATGGSWTKEGMILRSGEWKIRFNNRWTLNRRIDPNGELENSNGYQLFMNYGGAPDNLVVGGSNIALTDDAEYTVNVNWDPRAGFSAELVRTGDAPELTFNPNDFNFAVIGSATANGWNGDPGMDRNLFYKNVDGVHTWLGVFTFQSMDENGDPAVFKFRINDNWDELNLGGSIDALDAAGSASNIDSPGDGGYYIELSTADEGLSWQATINENHWGVIGEGSPVGNWDSDMDMTSEGFDAGISTYTITGDFTTGGWKFRAGDDWNMNLGGDFGFLTLDSPNNLMVSEDGTYKVTLNFNGETYSATTELQ